MRTFSWLGSWSTRPTALWIVYTIILVGVTLGLAALSRHALQLTREQWQISQQQTLEQNVRVCLWRLDSRLAPYLATLHDAAATDRLVSAMGSDEDFVIHRFAVRELGSKTADHRVSRPAWQSPWRIEPPCLRVRRGWQKRTVARWCSASNSTG